MDQRREHIMSRLRCHGETHAILDLVEQPPEGFSWSSWHTIHAVFTDGTFPWTCEAMMPTWEIPGIGRKVKSVRCSEIGDLSIGVLILASATAVIGDIPPQVIEQDEKNWRNITPSRMGIWVWVVELE